MNTLKIGIASREASRERTLNIAEGKYIPAGDEPKLWFESLAALSPVLSEQNRDLLRMIAETRPQSLRELAEASGRARSNLTRTLRTMTRYGLVRLEPGANRQLIPHVDYSRVEIEWLLCR